MLKDTRSLAVLATTVAVLVTAVLAAAVGGSWELEERDLTWEPSAPPEMEPQLPDVELEDVPASPGVTPSEGRWLTVLAWILAVLLAVVLAGWLVRRLRPMVVLRRHRPHVPATIGVAQDEEPELPVLQRGVAAAQRYLAEIPGPTDAVIAAWLALEEAASESGVRRAPAQTPTEFTVAVLARTSADPDAATELLGLYHRARFSRDAVDADDVDHAARCFARLAASWAVVSTSPTDPFTPSTSTTSATPTAPRQEP